MTCDHQWLVLSLDRDGLRCRCRAGCGRFLIVTRWLLEFVSDMAAKLEDTAHKHIGNNVMDPGYDWAHIDWYDGGRQHLHDEYLEWETEAKVSWEANPVLWVFRKSPPLTDERVELVDIANLAAILHHGGLVCSQAGNTKAEEG